MMIRSRALLYSAATDRYGKANVCENAVPVKRAKGRTKKSSVRNRFFISYSKFGSTICGRLTTLCRGRRLGRRRNGIHHPRRPPDNLKTERVFFVLWKGPWLKIYESAKRSLYQK